MQELQKMSHDLDVMEIEYINSEIEMETNEILREIDALKKQHTGIITAKSGLTLAKVRAEADAIEVISKAKAYAQE